MDKNVYVCFELIACLGDQPERKGINYMLGGGENFEARFGYSTNIKKIQESVPSCTNCLKSMMCDPFFLLLINKCDVCVNLNMMENSELMKYESSENYFTTVYLTPKKLTFADYKYINNVCHDKLVSKEWSENNVRVYCVVNGISKHGQDKIIWHADNCLVLQSLFVLSEKTI